jgi:glycosyltransferase 2 family protein
MTKPRSRSKWLWRLGQIIVWGCVAYFWGRSLLHNWEQLRSYQPDFRPLFLLLSLAILLVHIFVLSLIWRQSLIYLGSRRPWTETTRIWAISQLARYIPGGIWDIAGRLVLASRAGYSRSLVSVSILLEMVLQTIAALLIFCLSLFFWQDTSLVRFSFATLVLVPAGLLVLYPPVLNAILRRIASLLKREFIPLPLRYVDVFRLLLAHLGARVLIGTAFHFFIRSLYPWDFRLWPIAVGIFAAAWVVGFLVFFVPLGLGVREGVMTALLGAYLLVGPASVVAIGFRILVSIRDVLFAGAGWILNRSASSKASDATTMCPTE